MAHQDWRPTSSDNDSNVTRVRRYLLLLAPLFVILAVILVLAHESDQHVVAESQIQKTIIIYGFRPFPHEGGGAANVSGDIVSQFTDGSKIQGVQIRTLILDVKWGDPKPKLQALMNQIAGNNKKKLISILGLGESCDPGVKLEQKAFNKRSMTLKDEGSDITTADDDMTAGQRGLPEKIEADQALAHEYTTPFDSKLAAIATALAANPTSIPSANSVTTSRYLCNESYYEAMRLLSPDGGPTEGKALFVHVQAYPNSTLDQTDPTNAAHLMRMKKAVDVVLKQMVLNALAGPKPTFTPTPTPTPTPPKQPFPGDSDNDGCPDVRENDMTKTSGGQRNYLNFWDFFDTPQPLAVPLRDKVVDINDIYRIAGRFATVGDPNGDPLSHPPMFGYHTAYDRTFIGPHPWDLGPPNGAIGLNEIFWDAMQFAHNCN